MMQNIPMTVAVQISLLILCVCTGCQSLDSSDSTAPTPAFYTYSELEEKVGSRVAVCGFLDITNPKQADVLDLRDTSMLDLDRNIHSYFKSGDCVSIVGTLIRFTRQPDATPNEPVDLGKDKGYFAPPPVSVDTSYGNRNRDSFLMLVNIETVSLVREFGPR